jgi:hypothetical protein
VLEAYDGMTRSFKTEIVSAPLLATIPPKKLRISEGVGAVVKTVVP